MASRYQDLLNIYTQSNPILNPNLFDTSDMAQTKAAEVERASAAKQAEANGSPDGYNLATMRATGSGVASAKPMDRDFVTLSPFQFELKYGANARAQYAAAEAAGESARRAGTQGTRDGYQIAGDSLNSAVMGFANAFGGIGALATGLVNDEAGAWVSTKLGQLNQFSQSLQSRELNASRAAYGSQNELDAADNKAEAEQVTKDYGKVAGGTYRFLNDAYDSLANAFKDPNMATDTVASGVGSLFAGGPLSKGLRAIGTATIGRLGASEAIAAAASRASAGRYLGTSDRLILGAAEHAPMTAAIGLMEGGGAYQQTVDQSYQELIAQGVAPEEAARRANAAGLEAAAIQTPIAAATGRLVSRFEGHPTRVGSLSGAAGNMIRETVEETAQSAAGQVAQNVGMRDNVNPNQDLLEGVGEQAALGGLGGLGSAGLAQAPGVAFRASVETAKLPFKALGAGLKYQADRVRANNQKVQDQLLSGLYDQADQAVPDAQAEMDQVIANANPSVAEDLGRWAGEQVNRLQQSKAIQAAAQTVMAKGGAVKDKLASYFQVRDGVQDMQAAQDEATPAGAENTTMQSIKDAAVNVTQSQAVQDSLAKGKLMVKSAASAVNANVRAALSRMTTSQNNTPDSGGAANLNDQAQMMAGIAADAPELVDVKSAEQVLYHDSQGTIALSAPQRNALRTAVAAGKAAQSGSELASTYGLADADAVSRQVLTDKPSEGSNLSLNGHLQGIASAYNSGDLQLASQRLTDLRRFAQHLSNKVVSFNDALTGGNTNENNAVSFPALVNGRFVPNSGSTYIQPRSARSIQLAQEVAVQARTVADAVNNLSDAFPDLGIEHIEPAVLDASLSGKAETVANEYRNGQRAVPNNETKGVPSETAEPAQASEVAEPEAAPVEEQAATDSQLNADQSNSEQSETTVANEQRSEPEVTETPTETVEETPPAEPTEETDTSEDATNVASSENISSEPARFGGTENRISKAFRAAKTATSRIMESDSPLQTIRDAFKSKEALEELIGSKLNRGYSVEVAKAYTNFLKLGDGLKTIMEERLQSALKAKLDRGLKPEDMVNFLEGGALNAVIQNEDGSYSYDPKLLEAATLAGLQWYLKMNKNGTQLDDNDIRQMYGLSDTVPLPDGLAAMLSEGMGDAEVSRSLAAEIGRFWGMDINPNAPTNYGQAALEGMAKELIESMVAGGLIQETQVDTKDVLNVPHVSRYSPVLTEEVARADGSTYTKRKGPAINEETLAGLRQFPTAIEKAALIDGEEVNYVGEKPGDRNSKTQLRNPMVETTDQQREVIAKEQATEHRMNMPFVGMLTRLGEGLTMRLFGGGDTNGPLNVNDRRSLEGRNLTMQSAFRSIFNLMAEVQNRSDLDKVDPSEMPVFFDYAYTVVNRLQMLGKDNPQSNKLMREAILPTWKVMDLTNPDMRLAFSMGLAQALGIKVHQNSQQQTLKDLTEKLAQFPKTLELLRDDGELSEADVDTMKAEGVDSPVALHALMEYARLVDTAPADRKAFRSALYFEADGVTNGVVNAMSLFSSKDFTDTWLSNIERGGLWIGEQAASLFNLRSRGNGNELDLYGVAASNTSNYLTDLLRRNASDPAVSAKLTMVNAFLVQYLKGVDMDGDKLLLKRDVVKNPLTITVYGSGTNGIAGNLMDEALSKLYSDLSAAAGRMAGDKNLTLAEAMFPEMSKSEATQSLKGLEALLSQLTGSTLGVSEKSLYNEENSNPNVTIADPVEFTLSSAQKQAMQKNILHAFAEPMVQGITQTVGADLIDSMGTIKTQTQAWSLIGQFMFQNEYEKALAAKRKANPNMNSYELLSQAEADAIMKKISANLPSFGTGTQNFMFGMKQRLDLPFMTSKNGKALKLEFSRSLTDNMQTPAFGYMPGDAGVSGQPGLTIGSGDGQAVQNIIMNPETPAERLQIFDGIHSSVADMATMGRVSNQGVYDSWANNPMRSLAEAFDTFVKQVDLSGLNERQRTALFRAISGRQGIDADTNTLMSLLRREAATGLNKAKGIDERQAVLKVLQLSVDQMAGAATPYTREGIILSGSHAERAAQLNILKSQMAKGASPEATQGESAPQTSKVAEEAPKPSTAARGADVKLFTKGMDRYITKLTSDPTTRALLRDVTRSGKVDAYKVWTGSREELIQHAADMGISIPADRQKTFMGFTDPVSKQLFVVDGNAETMLHELIHAATYETVAAHYAGESVSPEVSAAIERIEQLMSQFREANLDGNAYQNALDEMDRQADAGNQAAELNEFMAWALSNQDLAEQLKGTQVENRYLLLAKKAVQALKALLWGGKRSAAVKDDVFTNLRFNTNIIMRAGQSSDMARQGLLFHDPSFGDNQRVSDLLGNIKAKVSDFVGEDAVRRVVNSAQARQSLANGARIMKAFTEAGFDMTKQEQMAFMHMVGIMGTAADLDANSTARMQDIYTHAIKNLSLGDFLQNPGENDPADNYQANRKLSLLAGKFAAREDALDRSSILPAFVALAQTNDEFRQILSKMDMPKGQYEAWNSVDGILDNLGDIAMDTVGRAVSGEGVRSKNAQQALDNLTMQMLETNEDAEWFIERFTKPVGSFTDRVNDGLTNLFQKAGEGAQNLVTKAKKDPNAKIKIALAQTLQSVTGLLHEQTGLEASMSLMSAANQSDGIWKPFYDLLKDLIGRTAENAGVYDLIKLARYHVSSLRQQYVENLPNIINSKFSTPLTAEQQEHMHRGLAQTDLASMLEGNKIADVLRWVKSASARQSKINELADTIRGLAPDQAKLMLAKSDQLAGWMVSKSTGSNLLRNADAIAHLLGEGVQVADPTPELVQAIDHYVSMKALDMQPTRTRNALEVLAGKESDGLNFVLNLLRGQRMIDDTKADGNARFNHYKGFMTAAPADGVSLIVAHDNEAASLLEKSYVRVGAFKGSEKDPSAKGRSYWMAPVSGKAPYSQGIAQNVQQTVGGVDHASGFTQGLTGGVITDPKLVARIAKAGTSETNGQALLPVYDKQGKLYAYERQVDPAMIARLKPDYNLASMMGQRSGRQMEEAAAFQINKLLVDNLRDMWDRDKNKAGRRNEYVNLLESTDPVVRDSVAIFSNEMRDYITDRFPEGFMVRKDMIDDAIGYRNASIGDAWTGTSRWSPETQQLVKNALMSIFGNKAYAHAVRAEKFLQNAIVQDLRTMIVIRSVVVPVGNAASNIYQLISRGVPVVPMMRSIPKKVSEIESWHKTRLRQMEAEAELLAETDPFKRQKLEAEIKGITDSHKRLTIWPLLEAGEFSSISDAGSREDVLLSEGKLSDYLEAVVDKLPPAVRTMGKYAIISKDTALFRALQKTVDYGDFVGKAILYDDLTKRKKMSSAEALAQITEEFVNYDRLPGRDRQYLESIGLLWFWNFKVRSAKVAMSMIRNNPVHALMAANLPTPITGIGLPLEDNLWASIFDGRAANSIGLHMAFRAPGLLPIGNLLG